MSAMKQKARKTDDLIGLTAADALKFVALGAERVNREDVARVVEHAREIRAAFAKGPLKIHRKAALRMLDLVTQQHAGELDRLPYCALAVMAFGLGYVLNPIDIIPDFIPDIGQLDDLRVFEAAARLARRSLKALPPERD